MLLNLDVLLCQKKIISKLIVEYRRITKNERIPRSDVKYEHVTWNYAETFTIDRESKTLEYYRKIGTDCEALWKYHVGEGIEELLNSIDATIFDKTEDDASDAILDSMEDKTYRIDVLFSDHTEKVTTGIFDKNGLPAEWDQFANLMRQFMEFYNGGEMLDPRHYELQRLTSDMVIYLSVVFSESYKRYYYQTDDNHIKVGDYVIVPVGDDGTERIVEVKEKEYYKRNQVPMPLDGVKTIIQKFIPPAKDDPTVECPVKNQRIYIDECYEHCNGLYSDFDEEQYKMCEKCRYHY